MDFKDPPTDRFAVGKQPKFAFGIKPHIKPRGIDVPGPGTYETDCVPMNQQNLAYGMGTDVRRGLNARNSHLYAGPGFYEHWQKDYTSHHG